MGRIALHIASLQGYEMPDHKPARKIVQPAALLFSLTVGSKQKIFVSPQYLGYGRVQALSICFLDRSVEAPCIRRSFSSLLGPSGKVIG